MGEWSYGHLRASGLLTPHELYVGCQRRQIQRNECDSEDDYRHQYTLKSECDNDESCNT